MNRRMPFRRLPHLVASAWLADFSAQAVERKLNLLHIHAGDHRPDGLRALGDSVLQTPNLDELVEQGFVFTPACTMGSTGVRSARPFYIYLAPLVPHDPREAEPEFNKPYDFEKVPLSSAFMPLHPFENGEMTAPLERETAHYGAAAPLKVANSKPVAWTPPSKIETKEDSE